jgi:hypothetical protein
MGCSFNFVEYVELAIDIRIPWLVLISRDYNNRKIEITRRFTLTYERQQKGSTEKGGESWTL